MMARWLAGLAVVAAVVILVFSAALPAGLALAAIVLLGLLFIGRAVAGRQLTGYTPADWPLLALLLLLPVNLWASPDLGVTLPRVYALIAAAALFWTVAALPERPWLQHAGWALLAAGLALALAVLAATPFSASTAGLPLNLASLQARLPAALLAPDRFNPNLSGHLLALFLPPALALAFAPRAAHPIQRLAAAALSLLLAALLLFTQSRGALLGVALAVPVMTLLVSRRWLWLWGPLALAGLGFGIFMLRDSAQAPAALSAALLAGGSDVTATAQGRLELWSRAFYLLQDFPFTGVGLGMPERVVNLLYPLFMVGPDNHWVHVHNSYLQIGSELGIPGLIAFSALLLAVGAALIWPARHAAAPWRKTLALGLLGSLIVFAVHGLVDAPLASPKLMVLFFALLGLMAAVAAPGQGQPAGEM
jgi:putative inorganic carbon (HCO3(-)) transporter